MKQFIFMGKRPLKLFFDDIIEAINEIEDFVAGMDFDEFVKDKKTYNAVIRSFEVIGEAVVHIPKELREKHNEINWQEIIGMRNIVIHEYFGTDDRIIWHAAKNDAPKLKSQIQNITDNYKD